MDPTSDPIPQVSCTQDETVIFPEQQSMEAFQTTLNIHEVASTQVTTQERQYPSLYDSYGTSFIAIVLAIGIIASVVGIVTYIYRKAKTDHAALTQFVTTMFALIAGVFIADKIIAGPSTELLNEQEALKVLEFIQQTCLMVFAYYFGTKAQPPKEEPPNMQ
jgi:hypothetical protein